jgi:hypothetical protein
MALLVRSALQIADTAIICDIECEGRPSGPKHERRWDVSAMFDPNEHSPEIIDQAEQGIAYGLARGILALEVGIQHTVRILKGPGQR